MKEITISHFKSRYPRSYYDLLQLLDIRAYNTKSLRLAGIRCVQIFAGKKKRYYRFVAGIESSLFGSVNFDLSAVDRYDDCYVLTIASSGMVLEGSSGSSGAQALEVEKIEYEVYVRNRRAYFANNTGNSGPTSKPMISLFIYSLSKLIDIDVICIRVFQEDLALINELQAIGFEIKDTEPGCITVMKSIEEEVTSLPLLD